MGAELGATTSLFHFDDRMATYLRATDRADIAALKKAIEDGRNPRDVKFALAEDDVPIAEFARIDDPTVIIARPPDEGVETDRTTVVDGEDETAPGLDVDRRDPPGRSSALAARARSRAR